MSLLAMISSASFSSRQSINSLEVSVEQSTAFANSLAKYSGFLVIPQGHNAVPLDEIAL